MFSDSSDIYITKICHPNPAVVSNPPVKHRDPRLLPVEVVVKKLCRRVAKMLREELAEAEHQVISPFIPLEQTGLGTRACGLCQRQRKKEKSLNEIKW